MALVRVYCGLASADSDARSASAGSMLTAAVVDDAGRLLDVCEISDDPTGYARLGALLVERSSGPSGAALAADSDDHTVVSLLTAAGRPLAIADDDAADDYAERFADDESLEEMESPPAERRAVGLARALQAGALSAVSLPAPRDLAGYKPVLAAHAALSNGRHSAAVALREVLRELYPAALRAYPDPAEPVPLAVLDALPEPGLLGGTSTRGRDSGVAADAIAAQLSADGVADAETIADAITSLRVAIAETPRRGTVNKALTSAVAETVRQAVAAVRACDTGCEALIGTLSARITTSTAVPAASRRTVRRSGSLGPAAPASAPPASSLHTVRPAESAPAPARVPTGGRRARPEPAAATSTPVVPQPLTAPPVAPQPIAPPPIAPPPMAPAPVAPAASLRSPGRPVSAPPSATPVSSPPHASPSSAATPAVPSTHWRESPTNRPVSASPPPPGLTPAVPPQRGTVPPAEAGEPFRATLTTAAINSARAERQRPTPITPRPNTKVDPPPARSGFGAADFTIPVPTPRPEPAPPGSRANWPLVGPADERANGAGGREPSYPFRDRPGDEVDRPADASPPDSRVTPPWQADDLPQEPPMLRLVEPPPLADRALHDDLNLTPLADPRLDTPPLRLVEPENTDSDRPSRSRRPVAELGPSPVVDESDGDLLIFAAAHSAWFTGHPEEFDVEWSSSADTGWRAAEQAAQPAVGDKTNSGLPKRVPQANLVPGSPLRDERPLRVVRDAASIAAHTTGYFQGWRRGQEIGGYAVGGRPGREAAGGWDFSRDPTGHEDSPEYEYRSAGYRS